MTTRTAELFRTQTLRAAPMRGVDRAANAIYDCKIIELGDVNDERPYTITEDSLADIVEKGNSASRRGLKARFTHPSMCDSGMGKHLGRWKNFRIVEGTVLANLHLADSAFDTPSGDLAGYVMDLAEEDPEVFGVSLSVIPTDECMQSFNEACSEEHAERVALRVARLRAADIVDEPAATRGGLFDISTPAGLPEAADWLLRTHFDEAEPSEVLSKVCEFMTKHYGRPIMATLDKQIAEPTPQEDLDTEVVDNVDINDESVDGQDLVGEANDYIEAFGDRGARWFLEGRNLLDCFREARTSDHSRIKDLENQVHELQTLLQNSMGETEPLSFSKPDELSAEKKQLVQRQEEFKKKGADPITAKWAASFSKKD